MAWGAGVATTCRSTHPTNTVITYDKFDAENTFYGGQLGARLHFERGRFSLDVAGKRWQVRVDNATHQVLTVFDVEAGTLAAIEDVGVPQGVHRVKHEAPVEELPEDPEPTAAGPEPTAVRREEVAEVLAAMAELSPAYRAALTLRHLQELSYQEVADALGLPIGTVKTHLHRARAALRARLAERGRTH